MKKVFIVLLILFVPIVHAEENTLYKYYNISRVYGPYSENSTDDFPNIDTSDYIYTSYTELNERPEDKDNREVITEEGYEYERVKDINYISIKNMENDITVKDLSLKYKGEDLKYETTDDLNIIKGSSEVTLHLNEEVNPYYITLNIKTNEDYGHLIFTGGYDGKMYVKHNVYMAFDYTWYGLESEYNYDSIDIWTKCILSEKLDDTRILTYLGEKTIYKYRDKLFHTYREDKIYSPGYLDGPSLEYPYRDDEDFIKYGKPIPIYVDESDNALDEDNLSYDLDEFSYEIVDVPNTGI